MRGYRGLVVLAVGLIAAVWLMPVAAQNLPAQLLTGRPGWFSTFQFPDPAHGTGADGMQDQHCEEKNSNWSGWNQVSLSCYAVPNPANGRWESSIVLRSYSGHTSNQYGSGYVIAVGGTRLNGQETLNEFTLSELGTGRQILYRNIQAPDVLGTDLNIWSTKDLNVAGKAHAYQGFSVGDPQEFGVTGSCSRGMFRGGILVKCLVP